MMGNKKQQKGNAQDGHSPTHEQPALGQIAQDQGKEQDDQIDHHKSPEKISHHGGIMAPTGKMRKEAKWSSALTPLPACW
jgi:hypothetical protein